MHYNVMAMWTLNLVGSISVISIMVSLMIIYLRCNRLFNVKIIKNGTYYL
jgi:hypothetical protein